MVRRFRRSTAFARCVARHPRAMPPSPCRAAYLLVVSTDPRRDAEAELRPPLLPSTEPEPVYLADPGEIADNAAAGAGGLSRRLVLWLVCGLVAAAAASAVFVVVVTRGGPPAPGAPTAQTAAEEFVAAINAGDKNRAATASCPAFADQAHAAAVTGADPGISFRLGPVRINGPHASAIITEHLEFNGASTDTPQQLSLQARSGRWLVCGTE
jgi:hypothetical protein